MATPVGIVGFRGYSGAELAVILEKHPHTQRNLLGKPFSGCRNFYRSQVPRARLFQTPGSYPPAANLPIKPLVEAGVVVREAGIVCDAKSGVSGAGRKPSLKTSFCE